MTSLNDLPAAAALSSFIRCYSLRHIPTKGLYTIKPIAAMHELCLMFCLTGDAPHLKSLAQNINQNRPYYIIGISTECSGTIYLNEPCDLLYIHFKPNGFHKLFELSPKLFLNKTMDAGAALGEPLQQFGDALKGCTDKEKIQSLTNSFLLHRMSQQNSTDLFDNITAASNIILNNININTVQLAKYVNMSLRNFERRFQQQVGISAKLYCRVVRFTNALMLKINSIQKAWTSIAQACGYFDQMHMIKDFQQFAGCSPSCFFKIPMIMEEQTATLSAK